MTSPSDVIWEIQPHTQAKHEILRRYLVSWYPILGKYHKSLVYIDGFCGPGKYLGGEPGSPIVAIEEALKHKQRLSDVNINFLFVDEREDRIEQLQQEIDKYSLPENYKTFSVLSEFERELRTLLDKIDSSNKNLPPTFAFIDPFGFKGLPFDLVERLLEIPKSEVFINIMADAINRFIAHPDEKTRQHIIDLFGTKEVLDIAEKSTQRIKDLRLLYQEQLESNSRFVRYFEMRDCYGKTIYYLFFASNHRMGHKKIKEAFWKVDNTSGFCFSDATDPNQLILFEVDETPKLAEKIVTKFAKQTVPVETIINYVEDDTAFLAKHMRESLKLLESSSKITVKEQKSNGKNRISNTFPKNAIIEFP